MKRRAEHHLDRDEFLRGGDDDGNDRNQQPAAQGSNLATPEQMAQRRIVKLKLPSQVLAEQQATGEENKPAAKLELASGFGAQATSAENAQPTSSATPSFLTNIYTPNQEAKNGSNQTEQKPAQGSLFGGLLGKPAETAKASEEKKEEEKKPSLFGDLFKSNQTPAPLFSSSGATGGLFSGGNQSATSNLFNQPTSGLFSNLFKTSESGSLANLANKDYSYVHKESGEKPEEKKEEKPAEKPAETKPTLFASLDQYKPATNLFSGDNASKPSLFANFATNTTPSFTSFLQTQQSSSGLFGGFKPKGDDEGSEGGDEEGDDEPERTPSPEADITKSKGNYQYQYDYEKIASKKVTKFKPGVKNILSEGEVSLNKKQDSNSHFILYRNKAKLVQYQGQIIPNLTKTEYLNPRQDALSVILYSVETPNQSTEQKAEGEGETKPAKPAFSKDIVKIMFATSDDCNEFKKALDKVLA